MKALFYCNNPFFLAHGGTQTLLESLMREIAALGVEVEPLRWWDATQTGDIIHFMNRPTGSLVEAAHNKGFKTVMTENIDHTASRGTFGLWLRKFALQCDRALGGPVAFRTSMNVYQQLDALVYVVELERQVAQYLYNVPAAKSHVIPHGLDEYALTDLATLQPEGDYLISIASIVQRKNNVLLAKAARIAQVPIVFLGKPFSESDPYFLEFKGLVDDRFVRYPGFVSRQEKHSLLRGARGFALLSQFESGCIALYEAAAAGLPLLLPTLPWAERVYQDARQREFVPTNSPQNVARKLREFYDRARRQPGQTFAIPTWREVARRYIVIYEAVLRNKALPNGL
jgi:glycosyltransferase involved in cell wall biosynthesis